jgi:hypothetical protein
VVLILIIVVVSNSVISKNLNSYEAYQILSVSFSWYNLSIDGEYMYKLNVTGRVMVLQHCIS